MAKGHKQLFVDTFEREHAITLRLLRAFPDAHSGFKPHPTGRTAVDVAWALVLGQERLMVKALTGGFDWSKPPTPPPPPPSTMSALVERLEAAHAQALEAVRAADEKALTDETVSFFVAPRTLGDVPKIEFLWFLLRDYVHHRGQLSIYARMVGAPVPSIYGPSGDEPWF
jgi:uncharacterized damage-inducible protein DinB